MLDKAAGTVSRGRQLQARPGGWTGACYCFSYRAGCSPCVVQELRSLTQLNVVEAPTPEGDKRSRVNTASAFIEAGRVAMLEGL